ncbi:ATPase family AAA domain-containing protein 5 isoform 1-T2 [Odontesthes bonariensis]|uniref:ATPase family AAA domain-containing protein 5 n=1 Tax=Odontesthes bonariensis TaxID=219752 RepID=UPI003F581DB7
MAGVVAMASVIEDFDTQPCKKPRKDAGSPVVKTITNYFSPVPKPVEKPFSPPRSNNIMDYFSRKVSSSKEKTTPPEQSKENCRMSQSAENNTDPEGGKRPSQKRVRKTSKAARKLVAESMSSTDESSCLIVEESHERVDSTADSTADAVGSCVLASETAALLSKFSAKACGKGRASGKADSKTVGDERAQRDEPGSKCEDAVKSEPALKTTEPSPIVSTRDDGKQVKAAARKAGRRQQKEAKHPEPEEMKAQSSLCDDNVEADVDEASQLNNSTVKISFEDFVRSQNQGSIEEDIEDDDVSKTTAEVEKLNSGQLDIPKVEENAGSPVPSVQISPRTVTIQAEVHVVSPKREAVKEVGKVASIFNRRKGANSPAETVSSPLTEAGNPLPSPTLKRRSNVVLQEEDLELAVIESESTPKSSEAERKQFMSAFKQPSVEGSKTKPVKGQGKQKQAGEKIVDASDKVTEDGSVIPACVEQVSQENKAAKKKPARKGRNKAKEENEAVTTSPAGEETVATVIEIDDKSEEPLVPSAPSVPAVRRSRREAAVRQTPQTTPTTPVRKSRRKNESPKDSVAGSVLPQNGPANTSTPKTRKSKHGVFAAEVVCPPDAEESPIRIRFSRVHKNVSTTKAENASDTIASLATETFSKSEKRKQAKKLLEKAKVIQHSKKTLEEKDSLRRSSRSKTKRSYCEDEVSVICIEDETAAPHSAPEKRKAQRPLRSLNDVLGKATPAAKETKAALGSKVAPSDQEKSVRKVSAIISIFDESSREGSENSQDDEQFRARREFLKSGLPESFRKQIAKTAATKEAFSMSCSSFQPVTHTTQPPNDCPLWSLPWPESSSLCHLKDLWSRTSNPPPSVSGSLSLSTVPACRSFSEKASGCRPEMTEHVRQLLMEEFSTSNPHFPAQMFIPRILKRRTDHQQQVAEQEAVRKKENTSTPPPCESVRGKRKRRDDEGEKTVKVAKKQKSNHSEKRITTAESEPPKRGGRTRRTQRSRPEEEVTGKAEPSLKSAPIPSEEDSVVVLDDEDDEDARTKDVVKEDVLWTDKYQPQHSSDIIDNAASVKRLHSWLKEWKIRADREERRNLKSKKEEEGCNDSNWDCGEEDFLDGEDRLCNTVLITGPTGVGKTAAVYACAQELGFKVFEVNASFQRSGRLILSQLKEATQSHQVDSQGVSALKPTYFNSYGTSSSAGSVRPGSSPRKGNSPRRVVSSPRKPPQSPSGVKKGGLAPTSLANFFKTGQPTSKEPPKTAKTQQAASSEKVLKASEAGSKKKDQATKLPAATTLKKSNSEEQNKKMATSLILFEEVDVVFDDDSGFLAAVKTFMTTTKRPVVLTTSDPAFSTMFDGSFEEIHFKKPSILNAGSYLQLLCLAEDTRSNPTDVSSLLRLNGCDIRQSLLQLQFWARSLSTRPLIHTCKNAEVKPETEEAASLPPCDTGCTESKLGLLNIEPERDIWELLRSQSLMEEAVCWELLTDSRRRGVDLLYSNMETLLCLPLTPLTTSKPKHCVSLSQEHKPFSHKLQPSSTSLQAAEAGDCSDDCSPVKVSNRMRRNKKRHRLPDQEGLRSESDSEDGFPSLCTPQSTTQPEEKVEESKVSERLKRKPLTREERIKSLPVSQCLESMADFLDNMSYMDSSLLVHPGGGSVHRISPVGAVVKDGMTDESRVETDGGTWSTRGRVLEIQAAVEALSFRKCQSSVADAWDKVQLLEGELGKEAAVDLTLPVAAHREGYSFTQDSPCQPQLVQRRREVMESLMFRGVFGTVSNRPAAALDYLPVMRTICRSEQLKEQGKVKRRFLHYLDAINLGVEKNTLQLLAEDFP